ncbi:MAG: N-acetylmuramic acid 6-phosphate etherase [Clostridia bacterium]|nr:N-acetylmuramic acid 6-phosphate etherase [Clostridia bacterium]
MLKTEARNPHTTHIDRMTTAEMLECIQRENYNAVRALEPAMPQIEAACDAIASTFERGGRLIYTGAGTSGRLGVLDAVECPPTYGVTPDTVIGLMAGGNEAVFSSAADIEDSAEEGIGDLKRINLTAADILVGISAAGGAGYVIAGIEYAKSLGCTTIAVTSNGDSRLAALADIAIVTDTGAEVITGSTRMKAGSAQKMVLNMLSTVSMVKTGKVYENMMINLRPTNAKLTARMIRITSEITGLDETAAKALLEANEWSIRRAVDAFEA